MNMLSETHGIAKDKINHLILNYFIQEGHQEAAVNFAQETGTNLFDHQTRNIPSNSNFINELGKEEAETAEGLAQIVNNYVRDDVSSESKPIFNGHASISGGYATITKRKEIKFLILKGKITEAIAKISEYFPTILDSNNLLHFKLLRLNLIEMIREHKIRSEVDTESESNFLHKILSFVRENLINKVTNSFKLLKELEITMSLLCFNFDPTIKNVQDQVDLPDELKALFNLSLRNQCYRVVNQAILNLDCDFIKNDQIGVIDEIESEDHYAGPKYMEIDISGTLHSANGDEPFEFETKQDDVSMKDEDDEDDEPNYNYDEPYDKNVAEIPTASQFQNNSLKNEELEDELNKLQNLSLESNLERILKLWIITEQRIIEANKS